MSSKLRVATVFSGIGAFEEALDQLGIEHEIVFACDNGERYLKMKEEEIRDATKGMSPENRELYVKDLYEKTGRKNLVKQSYFDNYDITEDRWHEDIRFMPCKEDQDLDILVGGSPCQSFSTYGNKMGLKDIRGTLFHDYIQLIQTVKPKVFVYENVRGLKIHDKGNTWKVVKKIFTGLQDYVFPNYGGSDIYRILDAHDYGLPQLRKRLFIVGIRKDVYKRPFEFPVPTGCRKEVKDFLDNDDTVPLKYFLPEKGFKWVTEKDRSKNKARLNRQVMGCQTAVQQYNWSGDFRFCPEQERFNTGKHIFIHEWKGQRGAIRQLTPDECFRLMGFENFKHDHIIDKVAWRQVGNSIAVPVIKAITKEILMQVLGWRKCGRGWIRPK